MALAELDSARVGAPIADERLFDCVNVILSYQNGDGGWATYENTRSYSALEVRPPMQTHGSGLIKRAAGGWPMGAPTAIASACMAVLPCRYAYVIANSYVRALQIINPSETFGDIVIDYSYVECASACMTSLAEFAHKVPAAQDGRDCGIPAAGPALRAKAAAAGRVLVRLLGRLLHLRGLVRVRSPLCRQCSVASDTF